MLEFAASSLLTDNAASWTLAGTRKPPCRTSERRKPGPADHAAMRAALRPLQQETLDTLERFHWHLQFVRSPLFQAPVPVLFDRDGTRFVVIREDGTLDEQPRLKLRG